MRQAVGMGWSESRAAQSRGAHNRKFMNRLRFYTLAVVLALTVGASLSALLSFGRDVNRAPETTITFLLDWKSGAYHAGFFVVDAKGFYKNENLEVRFEEASGAAQAAIIIGDGTYPLGLSTGDATLMAAEKGAQVVSVAAIYQRNPVVVFSLKSNAIKRPKDLLDKKVGIPLESIAYKEFLVFLKKTGLDQSRIQIVGVGFDTSPLLTNRVDALVGYSNNAAVQVEAKGKEIERLYLADYGVNPYGTVILANKDFLLANKDTVRRFLGASLRGWEFTSENPDEALELFLQSRAGHDRHFSQLSIAATHMLLYPAQNDPDFRIGRQYRERWEQTRGVLVDGGLLKGNQDTPSLFSNEFLPTSQGERTRGRRSPR